MRFTTKIIELNDHECAILLPEKCLNILGLQEGDEIRIVEDEEHSRFIIKPVKEDRAV